jgi:hypothetical protein
MQDRLGGPPRTEMKSQNVERTLIRKLWTYQCLGDPESLRLSRMLKLVRRLFHRDRTTAPAPRRCGRCRRAAHRIQKCPKVYPQLKKDVSDLVIKFCRLGSRPGPDSSLATANIFSHKGWAERTEPVLRLQSSSPVGHACPTGHNMQSRLKADGPYFAGQPRALVDRSGSVVEAVIGVMCTKYGKSSIISSITCRKS